MPLPLLPSDARHSRNVAAGSTAGALLLASQLMLGLNAWGDDTGIGVCRNAHSGPGCAVGPMPAGPNPGNNAGRNDNTKAPPDCGAMKQQMGQLCQKYNASPAAAQEGIRGEINNLQHQWSGSSCGNGGGLGCGGGGGPVQSSPGKSTGSSAGDTSGGDSVGGGGDGGSGSGSTQGSASTSAGQPANSGAGVAEIVRSGATTKSPPHNNGFVAIPVGVLHH
jgi:hypothetical protein